MLSFLGTHVNGPNLFLAGASAGTLLCKLATLPYSRLGRGDHLLIRPYSSPAVSHSHQRLGFRQFSACVQTQQAGYMGAPRCACHCLSFLLSSFNCTRSNKRSVSWYTSEGTITLFRALRSPEVVTSQTRCICQHCTTAFKVMPVLLLLWLLVNEGLCAFLVLSM